MKKLKDFIYDKNDIVIAILILAVAALIISWRLGIILEYPKQLLGTDDPVFDTPVSDDEDSDLPVDDEGEDPQSGEGDQPQGSEGETDETQGDETEEDIPLWDGGVLTEDVEV